MDGRKSVVDRRHSLLPRVLVKAVAQGCRTRYRRSLPRRMWPDDTPSQIEILNKLLSLSGTTKAALHNAKLLQRSAAANVPSGILRTPAPQAVRPPSGPSIDDEKVLCRLFWHSPQYVQR